MKAIVALDQGTTSSRSRVYGPEGELLGAAQMEFRQGFPQPGWVEHDAEAIWQTQRETALEAVKAAGLTAADVAAIGITNQRETVVLWDRATGRPLGPAIVWQDRRTAGACDALRAAGHDALIRERTGLEVDAYFSATKLAWMLDHYPDARRRAAAGELACGTIDSWLIWRLTEGRVHATDASNASRTMCYDIHAGDWCDELLALFGIPRELLPTVADSRGVVGETTLLGRPVPIAGVAGDQQAALYGQGCLAPAQAKCTYGTGCFILANTGDAAVASANRLLTTVAWQLDGVRTYAQEGSVFAGGATVQWLRDGLGIIASAAEVEALAASTPDAGGVWLVPAFTGLGAPYWDGQARGTILGLTRGSGRAQLARAALESIVHQVCDVAAAMARDAGQPVATLRVDGGACANDLLMQMQADLLGAARLAGEAVGLWTPGVDLPAASAAAATFTPSMDTATRERRRAGWARAVERSRDWAQDEEVSS